MNDRRRIELPVRYYSGAPAASPKGLMTVPWTLDLAHTALIELHCWNFGFPGAPPVPDDFWVFMGSTQNHERMVPIVAEVIAPALEAGRRAGMPIVHVQPESVARRYPHLQPPSISDFGFRISDGEGKGERSSTTEPARPPVTANPKSEIRNPKSPAAPVTDDARRRSEQVHGEGYMAWSGWERLDVAEPVRPHPGDTMIATTEQFDAWLRERGITTLLYMGFATNLCILESPAAMKPMRGLGYRCVILREATMGVEFPDTLEALTHTRAALRYIEAWVGYSASVADLMRALP